MIQRPNPIRALVAFLLPPSGRQIDGVEMMDDGGFLMSSWGDQALG